MKRNLLLNTLALFIFLSAVNSTFAADVFVSTSEQLKAACTNAISGNVIKIAKGSYDGTFRLSGKSHITLQSYNGTVTLRGNLNPDNAGDTILTIENCS